MAITKYPRNGGYWFSTTLALLLVLVTFSPSEGCGVSTHINIGEEALHFFHTTNTTVDYASIIRKHNGAFVAGTPFPDAMYSPVCFFGWLHDVAEDTHWLPFLKTSIEYVRKKYSQPWTEETEKLVAFIFGIVSHQISDVTWHSLGIQQGFIRTMAALNFHGSFNRAHTIADFGGDMMTQFSKDIERSAINKWYIPLDDLYNIYEEFYSNRYPWRRVPKVSIEVCSKFLYLEALLEIYGGALIYKPFAEQSPFLHNHMHDFFLGGINDMASWTTLIWKETATMLDNGTNQCHFPSNQNPLFLKCHTTMDNTINIHTQITRNNPKRKHLVLELKKRKHRLIESKGWDVADISSVRTERGIVMYPGERLNGYIKGRMEEKKKKQETDNWLKRMGELNLKISLIGSSSPYASTGSSITHITINNKPYVAIGAPNHGSPGQPQTGHALVIRMSKLQNVNERDGKSLEEISDVILRGEEMMGKFGWSITSMLYNGDSYEDLIIGAPVIGASHLNYYGKVYIYYGSKHGISTQPNVTLNYENQSKYTNFGHHLATCNNNNLVIGSPFDSMQTGLVRSINVKDGNHRDMQGSSAYSWFGYSTVCGMDKGREILMVGSPMTRLDGKQNVGMVTIFIENRLVPILLNGDAQFSEFGSSLTLGTPLGKNYVVLAVSSPSKSVPSTTPDASLQQAGEVSLYNLTAIIQSPSISAHHYIIGTVRGDLAFGRFGDSVEFVDVDGDGREELIVSAPRRSTSTLDELNGGSEGAVYLYKIDDIVGSTSSNKALKIFQGKEAHARFGSSFKVVPTSNKKKKLVISSPYSSIKAFRSGSIHVYDL